MSDRPTPETDVCIIERRHIHKRDGSSQLLELIDAEFARRLVRDLAEARDVLKKIKHIFVNGGDTYLDFVKVGNIARDYLEKYWAEQLLDVCKTTNIISDEQISLELPEKYKPEFEEFMRGKTCPILDDGQRGVYSWDFEQFLKSVLKNMKNEKE